MPDPSSDLNLLFGILTLQLDFIRQDELIAALHAWVLDKTRPLGQVLRERGALGPDECALLESLLAKHLERHGNDPEKSLAAVSTVVSVREELKRITDRGVRDSLAHVPVTRVRDGDPFATRAPSMTRDDEEGVPPFEEVPTGRPGSPRSRFRILRPHARGGLGQVFVALDEELGREVALKEIQTRHADDHASRARFLLEAEITGRLEHPGIVPVYGLGTYADGRPFYAMRFIKGDSLAEAILRFHHADPPGRDAGERALELRKLLGRFLDVCNAIEYAHSRGVLHRDLKPGNIMLGPYGETLVVDWGLARVAGSSARPETSTESNKALVPASGGAAATRYGEVVGTPSFMPPEQAAGQIDRLGPASDVYSLGATLYCLLTGRAPFSDQDSDKLLERVRRGTFAPPRQVKPGVDPALEAICLKAMATRPADRYPSAKELADDVEHWLADEPVSAHREPLPARLGRWARKHRALVGSSAVGAVLLLLAAVGGVVLAGAWESRQHAHEKELNALESQRLEDVAQAQRAQAHRLYLANMDLAWRAWRGEELSPVLRGLQEDLPWPGGKDLRGIEWYALWRRCHRDRFTLRGHDTQVWCVAFPPDGRTLASASGQWNQPGEVRLWDTETGEAWAPAGGHAREVYALAFAEDGRTLASASVDRVVQTWDVDPRAKRAVPKRRFVLREETDRIYCLAFAPDGKTLASGHEDGTIRLWELDTGTRTALLQDGPPKPIVRRVLSIAFSRDGRFLASASLDGSVRLWQVRDRKLLASDREGWGDVVCFSPAGNVLALGAKEGTVHLWDLSEKAVQVTLARRPSLKGPGGDVYALAFLSAGNLLASAGASGAVRLWDLQRHQQMRLLKGHPGPVRSLAFSPDGKALASASEDQTVRLWDVSDRERDFLPGYGGSFFSLAISPDGRTLALGDADRAVQIVDAGSGDKRLALRHADEVSSVAFSPDGKRLASACWDQGVRLWDVRTGKQGPLLRGRPGLVHSLAFSPDGRVLACGGRVDVAKNVNRPLLTLWDVATGQLLSTLDGHRSAVLAVAFSPDGATLASGGYDGRVILWDVAGRRPGRSFVVVEKGEIWCVAFAPDGKTVAAGSSGGRVTLLDRDGEKPPITQDGHSGIVFSLAFSPDGQALLSGGQDGRLREWYLATGEGVLLDDLQAAIQAIRFSADGRLAAYRGLDTGVHLLRAATNAEVLEVYERAVRQSPNDVELLLALVVRRGAYLERDVRQEKQRTEAQRRLEQGRAILRRLRDASRLTEEQQKWLGAFERVLESLSLQVD